MDILCRELRHFMERVHPGDLTAYQSDPKLESRDNFLYVGAGSYFQLYLRMYDFCKRLEKEEMSDYLEFEKPPLVLSSAAFLKKASI